MDLPRSMLEVMEADAMYANFAVNSPRNFLPSLPDLRYPPHAISRNGPHFPAALFFPFLLPPVSWRAGSQNTQDPSPSRTPLLGDRWSSTAHCSYGCSPTILSRIIDLPMFFINWDSDIFMVSGFMPFGEINYHPSFGFWWEGGGQD